MFSRHIKTGIKRHLSHQLNRMLMAPLPILEQLKMHRGKLKSGLSLLIRIERLSGFLYNFCKSDDFIQSERYVLTDDNYPAPFNGFCKVAVWDQTV